MSLPDVIKDMRDYLDENWSNDIEKPLIIYTRDLRMMDVQRYDYILFEAVVEGDEFAGIGGWEYRRYVTWRLIIRTMRSWERALEILTEIRRILRDASVWSGKYVIVRVADVDDLSDREKKVYGFMVRIEGFKIEVR